MEERGRPRLAHLATYIHIYTHAKHPSGQTARVGAMGSAAPAPHHRGTDGEAPAALMPSPRQSSSQPALRSRHSARLSHVWMLVLVLVSLLLVCVHTAGAAPYCHHDDMWLPAAGETHSSGDRHVLTGVFLWAINHRFGHTWVMYAMHASQDQCYTCM